MLRKLILVAIIMISIMPSSFALSTTNNQQYNTNGLKVIYQKVNFFIANTYQNVDLMLTLNPTSRVNKQLQYAQDRGKEAQVWAKMGQTKASMRALNSERGMMQAALQEATKTENLKATMKKINNSTKIMNTEKSILLNIYNKRNNTNATEIIKNHYENMSNMVNGVMNNLTILNTVRNTNMQNELNKISKIAGVNVNTIYNNIQQTGELSQSNINTIINIANSKYSTYLNEFNNKTVALVLNKNGKMTQTIYVKINNNKISQINNIANPDIKLQVTPEKVTEMIKNIQKGNNIGITEEIAGMTSKGSILSNAGNMINSIVK